MNAYNSSAGRISSIDIITGNVCNGFLLCHDLHHGFDSSLFTLVVKEGRVVVHFLEVTHDLARLYHNVTFRLLRADPCLKFTWARFAWSFLPFV